LHRSNDQPVGEFVAKRKKKRKARDASRARRSDARKRRSPTQLKKQGQLRKGADAVPSLQQGPVLVARRLGSGQLLRTQATWPAIVERMSRYSLGEALELIGRISCVVFHAGIDDVGIQRMLCRVFLEDKADIVWNEVINQRERDAQRYGIASTLALFDHATLIAAAKVACLTLHPGEPTIESSMRPLGEAILMLNDIVNKELLPPAPPSEETVESRRAFVYYLFVVGLFQMQDNHVHLFARAFDLFLTDKPALQATSTAYIDLPALAERVTGLGPHALWAILVGYMSHFYLIKADNAHSANAFITKDFFSSGYNFSAQETEAFSRILVRDAGELQSDLKARGSIENLRTFDVLAFESSPLVVDGDRLYCPSPLFLLRRMTTGLYHMLLNSNETKEERDRYQVYVGDLFQDYVHRLLLRVYGQKSGASPRYIDEATINAVLTRNAPKGFTPKKCDGLVVYDDAVVVIETKAKFFRADVRAGDNRDLFFTRLDEICVRGGKQIEATITQIRSGALRSLGVDPASITHFYPVLVSLQDLPVRPPIHDWIAERLRDENVLTDSDIAPFQWMNIGELEVLEIGLREGIDLRVFLDRKMADAWGKRESVNNYMHVRNYPASHSQHNPYLANLYKELDGRAISYFSSRAKTLASGA
jgi:hypothetical protein